MIYFFYGTDIEKRGSARDTIARPPTGRAGSPDSILEMNDVSWDREKFENLAKSNSLFEAKQVITLENVLENAEAKDFILGKLAELKESGNIFIFLEKKALKDTVTKFTKSSEEVKEFALPKGKENKADVFAITYPFERRDKKNMWLEFHKLRETDTSAEALSGILFWKIKSMLLAGRSAKWTEAELKKLSSKLVSLHHDAHRGLIDFQTGLEKFIIDSL
jgi:hypothetical protein